MRIKKGFTLAEVLIAVGIIGIIAAIMAQSFNNIKPDKTKMLFLKAYDSLSEAIIAMEEDPFLYGKRITTANNEDIDIKNHPFLDQVAHAHPYINVQDGNLKFARILEQALKGDNGETINNGTTYRFTSGPGKYTWEVTPFGSIENITISNTNGELTVDGYANEIKLTIDDNENDTFRMCVPANGKIWILNEINGTTTTNRGLTYLRNRRNVKSINDQNVTSGYDQCNPERINLSGTGTSYKTLSD